MEAQRWVTDVGGGPMVARWGSEHPSVPMIVLLHGNGTSEHSLIEMSPWLPHGPVSYVAVRAPFERSRGYGWYADSDGAPDPDELVRSAQWLLDWMGTEGDPDRPVLVLGFREGVTTAGAMMLLEPERFAGGLLLYGALPLDAGLPTERGRLRGMPVYLARGTEDTKTPEELLTRTRTWLAAHSGAPLWSDEVEGGDQVAGTVVGGVGTWLTDRLDHLRAHGENPLPDGDEPVWPGLTAGGLLPSRAGEPPETTAAIPQRQVSQIPPSELRGPLWERLVALDGVTSGEAAVGPPGTWSLRLDRGAARGPDTAYLQPADGEFAHLHPPDDGALHLVLPDDLAYDAVAKGWAVPHPLAGLRLGSGAVLVPGPRDETELGIVTAVVGAAHRHASTPP